MSHNDICPCSEPCPLQRAMEMIGGKWKLAILCSLGVCAVGKAYGDFYSLCH